GRSPRHRDGCASTGCAAGCLSCRVFLDLAFAVFAPELGDILAVLDEFTDGYIEDLGEPDQGGITWVFAPFFKPGDVRLMDAVALMKHRRSEFLLGEVAGLACYLYAAAHQFKLPTNGRIFELLFVACVATPLHTCAPFRVAKV